MRSLLRLVSYLAVSSLIFILAYLFIPRSYEVQSFVKLEGTNYWELSTGSTIAYSLLEPKGSKKPFPIIYLHGGPGGAIGEGTRSMLLPFTAQGYEVFAYDQIGSGSSDRLDHIEEYTVDRHRADLGEIITKIAAEKVILIGQSWGSVLATFFAVSNSEKIASIIMTGPGPIFPLNETLASLQAPDSLNIKLPAYSNAEGNKEVYTLRDKCIKWFAYRTGKKLASDAEVDDFFTQLSNVLNRSAFYDVNKLKESQGGGGYYAHIMTFKSLLKMEDPREQMKELNVPVLLLRGQYDNQKWGFAQEYLDILPDVRLELIPLAGHFIQEEQASLYYEKINAFLEAHDAQDEAASEAPKG